WYAIVEMATGLIGLVFHFLFIGVTAIVYDRVFPAIGHGMLQQIVKWSVAALLILPQSLLLGMTFPLMSAGVMRRERSRPGEVLSMLYFSNSLGAAIGVLVAGFALVRWWGLPGTLATAGVLNLVVALVIILLVRTTSPRLSLEDLFGNRSAGQREWSIDRRWVVLIGASFATALSSFIYEIGWIRMLSLVLGSATHSFELMLSAFILGLAIGAWWIGRIADRGSATQKLAVVQLAMGCLAIATLPVYLKTFDWMAEFMAAFAKTSQGYVAFSVTRYAICLAVMLPATICAGMTLPLITRSLSVGTAGERAIGQVYAMNTLGSIVGAGLAGLVLLPIVGLKWLIVIGAGIDIAVGLVLMVETSSFTRWLTVPRIAVAGTVAALLAMVVARSQFDQSLLSSGVYRHGVVRALGGWPVTYYKDGRTATVSMRRVPSTGILSLITNGKVDASLGPEWMSTEPPLPGPLNLDAPTQLFISLLPLAHVPHAKSAAVIGQGSGMTTHVLLGSPEFKRVVTVEIEPLMIEASRNFYPANRRAFDDKRSQYVIDDARSYFATERGTFDLIVAEPSNPWVSGVAGLFTSEFYSRVKQRLSPNGVFAQWLQVYEINDDLVLSVLDAIDDNFESWEIFFTAGRNVLIVASPKKLGEPDWSVMRYPGVASDLRITWPVTGPSLERMRIAG
ncbi:MAG TPA: fused MFS/spermidine synthase, partial [Gemmatimonadaceae bacterium]